MKKQFSLCMMFMFILVLLAGCGTQENSASNKGTESSSADWASRFVIWNDDLYEILDEKVNAEEIGEEIGEITKYSDFEGIYSNGFSNKYPAGTKLFKIEEVELSEGMAIQIGESEFMKAKNTGAYAK